MARSRRLLAVCLIALAWCGNRPALAVQGAPAASRCFAGFADCLEGRFLDFWEHNGGLMVFGYPLTPLASHELNRDLGATYPTQWLERHRFEAHPENQAPYDVLLGRL